MQVSSKNYNRFLLLEMSYGTNDTGVPSAQIQSQLDNVDIDESVASCMSTIPLTKPNGRLTNKLPQSDFPPGSKIDSASSHGASIWARKAIINLILEDGSTYSLFLKVAKGVEGLGLVHGEYEAARALYAVAPTFIPRPIGAGTYKSTPEIHFYLSECVHMDEGVPDMQRFCASLAKMHIDSVPYSPKGQFGFHVVTYNGNKARDVTWCDTWEEMFSNSMRTRVQQERDAQGPSPELGKLLPALYDKVIPRLLRPLHTGEKKIKPVLVHGNVWYGNLATNASTNEPVVYDPATIWAHNECEYRKDYFCD